jgi:predicted small lipoprotein YifL
MITAAVGLFALAGCGESGPKTYPVKGKVALIGGDVQKLVGHSVEAALDGDTNVRATGIIGPDGTFTLETLQDGKIKKGAREGTYRVRIFPADEDDNGKKLRKPPIAARHFKFETSGLSFQVPASGELNLELATR